MTPLISIILPAYNASKTLANAIRSVQQQIFTNWQLLIVNDGSQDNTKEIAEEFANKDHRVHVITQPNGGRSAARNTGLSQACGDYIAFLDADDCFLPNTLQDLFSAGQKNNSDLVIGEICYNKVFRAFLTDRFFDGKDMAKYLVLMVKNQIVLNSVGNKLFKKSIIQQHAVRFPFEREMGEDLVFVLRYCNQIKNMITISVPVYDYIPSTQSITKSAYKSSYIDRKHVIHNLWIDLYKKWNLPLDEIYGSFFNYRMFGCINAAATSFVLLREVTADTFGDVQILQFANNIQNTKYDNLFAKLIRAKHTYLWMILACFIGYAKKIKNIYMKRIS